MDDPTLRGHHSGHPGRPRPRALQRVLPGWAWAIVAAVATVVAILARSDPPVEISLAALAVTAAGLTIATSLGPRSPPLPVGPRAVRMPLLSVREALRSGALGREDLVHLLDRLERVSVRPTLPIRSSEEVQAIVRASEQDFLRYLEARVRELEGAL